MLSCASATVYFILHIYIFDNPGGRFFGQVFSIEPRIFSVVLAESSHGGDSFAYIPILDLKIIIIVLCRSDLVEALKHITL